MTKCTFPEFIAAVAEVKTEEYLQSVLSNLGFTLPGPTKLYEDNMAAIQMVNTKRLTESSQHIDISYFANQD